MLRSFQTCPKSCLSILHLSPQIWSVSEWQGQKAFLNLSSCSHSCQSISGLCLEYKRQARAAWNHSLCFLFFPLSHPIKTSNSEWLRELLMPVQVPSANPAHGNLSRGAHSKLPNIHCHFLGTKLLDDFPSRQHLREFFSHILRADLRGRFFSSL